MTFTRFLLCLPLLCRLSTCTALLHAFVEAYPAAFKVLLNVSAPRFESCS
jgi:hypothetical protein